VGLIHRPAALASFALTAPADFNKLEIVMNIDRAGGLFFFFVGLSFFSLSLKLPVGKFTQPGPGIFPLILSLLLTAIGVLIFFSAKQKEKIGRAKDRENSAKPLSIILLTIAFIFLMGPLGYLPASFLYLFGLFFFVSCMKWFISAGISGILAAGTWYFFGKILGIFLPLGPWNL
jgi:putative tricarboxylic transport membrane protein